MSNLIKPFVDETNNNLISNISLNEEEIALRNIEREILKQMPLKGVHGIKKVFMRQEKSPIYVEETGEFKKGEYHGKGLEWRFPDKHFKEGLFKNNKFQGSKKNPLTKKVFKIILDANDLNK